MTSVVRVLLAAACLAAGCLCEELRRYTSSCGGVGGGGGVPAALDSGLVCGRRRHYERYREKPLRSSNPWDRVEYASFRGIPYGKPPLGHLRFKELEQVPPWSGYLDASVEGPVCPQYDYLFYSVTERRAVSEDCITVNVHVPMHALQIAQHRHRDRTLNEYKGVPILVFIHGGGFVFGSGDSDLYGPEFMVEHEVMVVTFNYRLGPMGFLSLNSSEVPGNAGLRDQVALLRWVQRNGGALGGDVERVTLAGQSAGAVSVHLLTLSPVTSGLFRNVFLMSGVSVRGFTTTSPAYAKTVANSFLTLLGINSTDRCVVHEQLTRAPLDALMAAQKALVDQFGTVLFAPVVETEFEGVTRIIDADPEILLAIGRGTNVPMLIQFLDKDCEIFLARFDEIDIAGTVTRSPEILVPVQLLYNSEPTTLPYRINAIQDAYFSKNESVLDNYVAYCTDAYFKYPAINLARQRLKGGGKTYLYEFDYEGVYRIFLEPGYEFTGAVHTEDVTYIFKTNSKVAVEQRLVDQSTDGEMQRRMQLWLAKFMKFNHASQSNRGFSSRGPTLSKEYLLGADSKPHHELYVDMLPQHLRELTKFFDELYE